MCRSFSNIFDFVIEFFYHFMQLISVDQKPIFFIQLEKSLALAWAKILMTPIHHNADELKMVIKSVFIG